MFKLYEHKLGVHKNALHEMKIGNGIIAIGTNTGNVLRCLVDGEKKSDEIVVEKNTSVRNVFIDPSGGHIVINMENNNNYYLHASSNKCVLLKDNVPITCVAWNRESIPKDSRNVLVGTSNGLLYATRFGLKIEAFEKLAHFEFRIDSIEMEHFEDRKEMYGYVMLSSVENGALRLYEYLGKMDHDAFNGEWFNRDEEDFREFVGQGNGRICFFHKRERERARAFGVLTGQGVFVGQFRFQRMKKEIVVDSEMIGFPNVAGVQKKSNPMSMLLTEFHIVLLYEKYVKVVNKLNQVVVFHQNFDARAGHVKGLCMDVTFKSMWVYSDRKVYELDMNNENKEIWKLYMYQGMNGSNRHKNYFEKAIGMCSSHEQRMEVMQAQGNFLYKRKKYEHAAKLYAQTNRSLEQTALAFLNGQHQKALKVYLVEKLKRMPVGDKTQCTIVCTWLVEVYLNSFNMLDTSDVETYANSLYEFKQFLTDYKKQLDPDTTFSLIASHGRSDELVFYANLINDYEKVVAFHMQKRDCRSAIEILSSAPSSNKVKELYYKYSRDLMQAVPKETMDAWKNVQGGLETSRLIPSIVQYLKRYDTIGDKSNQQKHHAATDSVIDYLSHAVKKGDRDPTIHNYLLYLFAKHPDERQLIKFLRQPHHKATDRKSKFLFDVTYALRLCTQNNKNRATIYIYSAMGLYYEAVEKALQVDVKAAKEIASQPRDEEMRRKLWILIAKHLIDTGSDVKEAISIIRESKQLLKIEDLLPFFPDFATINDFRSEICESLEKYNSRIDELKTEMIEYTESADLIRADMKQLRKRVTLVSGSQRCDLTGENILDKEFYVFPCGHAFHAQALRNEMQNHLNSFQRQNVKQLISKLNTLGKTTITSFFKGNQLTAEQQQSERELIQAKLDSIVAAECIFCGEVMIKSITMPFITDEEQETEGDDWKI